MNFETSEGRILEANASHPSHCGDGKLRERLPPPASGLDSCWHGPLGAFLPRGSSMNEREAQLAAAKLGNIGKIRRGRGWRI